MIIAIASQKGGTGKTSTSISLAAGLAHKGKKVLLVDVDSQANSSKVLLREYQKIPKEQTIYATIIERGPLPIHATQVANLSIVPSHILLSNTDYELTIAKDHREARLKSQLDIIKRTFRTPLEPLDSILVTFLGLYGPKREQPINSMAYESGCGMRNQR
jgi:chromosome partitioning protein